MMSSKKKKIAQKYRTEWQTTWPFICPSHKGRHHAFCKLCKKDLSIQGGGGNDIVSHVQSISHKNVSICLKNTQKLTPAMFIPNRDRRTLNAELLFTDFLIEHNIALNASEHAGDLFRNMFPDSEIAAKYACKRTKTTSLVKLLGKHEQESIVSKIKNTVFSIATDGSNDMNASKLYPVLVRFYDTTIHRVMTVLLGIQECTTTSTGQNIFLLLNDELNTHELSWSQVISFGTDNANVMVGKKSGVAAFILDKNSNCYIAGCCCHLMHIAAKTGYKALGIPLEDLLVDIYYYLDKSAKRQQTLKQFQDLYSEESRKILKHVSTRWLSLSTCLQRLVDQWDALLQYFRGEVSNSSGSSVSKSAGSSASKAAGSSVSKSAGSSASKAAGSSASKAAGSSASKAAGSSASKAAGSSASKVPTAAEHSKSVSAVRSDEATSACVSVSKSTGSSVSKVPTAAKHSKGVSTVRSDATRSSSKSAVLSNRTSSGKGPVLSEFDVSKYLDTEKQPNIRKKLKEPISKVTYTSKVQNIFNMLKDRNVRLYALFLVAVLPMFDKANCFLQTETPVIHKQLHVLKELLKDVFIKFVKPTVILSASDVTKIDYTSSENHKADIFIGVNAKTFISQHGEEKFDMKAFYSNVLQFYVKTVKYMLEKLPYNSDVLYNIQVVDIDKRETMSFENLNYFLDKFPCLLTKACGSISKDHVENEFARYQSFIFADNVVVKDEIDTTWYNISLIKGSDGSDLFAKLSIIVLSLLTIFHSNSDCERIFSIVGKNLNEFRPNMSTSTLNMLLLRKIGSSGDCFTRQYDAELLKSAKSCTHLDLQANNSTAEG